uniref:CCHC-type domain-containing protein n=1 Tax=Tanacetum cinerariifolium TaxID=118510 RepID=A0A699GR88_TANCI|nr:hypothetical protein [Tanacetum cinerariifolium]
MVNTRTNEPHVRDETLRSAVLQVFQKANAPVNAALTTLQTDLTTLTDRIQALMMFQNFAIREFTRINSGEGTTNKGGGYGRLTRLDFPKFSGDDVNGWLFRVKQFFLIDNVQEDQKLRYVSSSTPVTKPVLALPSATTENVGKVVKTGFWKQLTQKELEEKRAKGLCFYCDQKYAPGHKFHGQLYSLEVSMDEEDQEEEVCIDTEVREDTQTMRVRGYVGKQPLHILIDCGSTHNFLDTSAAKRLPCQLSATTPLRVDVANGSKMISSSECKTVKWTLQRNKYEADCMVLPLRGYNMVLGIQRLFTLGDINCNFINLTMKFNYQGKKSVLRGSKKGSLQWIQGKQVITEGQWKQAHLASMIVYVYPAQLMQLQEETARSFDDNLPLKQLLSTYEVVFAMPTAFPPPRAHDHTITLLPNTPPVTVRPYRLPPNKKDNVKQMLKELLDAGVIRVSRSSFSSPIVIQIHGSDQEKKIQKIDGLARSLLIQGLSNDIYSLTDSNKTAKDALVRQMLGSEYGEQDRKAAVLYDYETLKATEGEFFIDTYIRYLQYATMMRHNKNLMDINIDVLYNILNKNQRDVNDAMGLKKKTVVVTSDSLALIAEKTKVSKRKEKVVVSSDSKGSDEDDFSELKKITALLAKAFNRKKFYSKPTNNNLRTSSASNSANKKQEFVKSDDKKEDKKVEEKKRNMSKVKCYNCKKEGHFAKDCKKAKVKDYEYYKIKMLLAKKDKDEQVLLAEDHAWMESSSDSDQEINANMVFMAQIEKVLSNSEASSLYSDDKIDEHRKQIADQEILFDKMSYQLVEMNNDVLKLKDNLLEKETKISKLEECVRNKDLEIEKCLERLNDCENKLHRIRQTNQTIHMIMPYKDKLYNGRKGIGFENPSYFCKAKDLRPTLYDERVINLGYTLMFLTHSDEALEIEKFKRARENKIEFSYDYGNLNASYVNEKINLSDDYFQEIINPDFDKIDSSFQQTSLLKPYVSIVILEKIIIYLEDEVIVQIYLWIVDSSCSKHMTGNRALLMNFVEKFLGTVRFGNNDFAVIAGYGDVIGSMMIKKVYYVEGLGHNLFSVGKFCDKSLEVVFRKFSCFVRNEHGVDLLTGDCSSNLYTIALNEIASNSSPCLLAKAYSSQSWLY